MIKSENALLNSLVYVDVRGRDIGSYVDEACALLDQRLEMPTGYRLEWSGQFEAMERANRTLRVVVPITLVIIFLLLYINFLAGFLPILWGGGTGATVMKRIAAPMVGGMVSATVLNLLVVPVLDALWREWQLREAWVHNRDAEAPRKRTGVGADNFLAGRTGHD